MYACLYTADTNDINQSKNHCTQNYCGWNQFIYFLLNTAADICSNRIIHAIVHFYIIFIHYITFDRFYFPFVWVRLKWVGVCSSTATSSMILFLFLFIHFVRRRRLHEFSYKRGRSEQWKGAEKKNFPIEKQNKKKMRENFFKSVDVSPHNSVLFSWRGQNDKGGGRDVGRSRVFGSVECDFISEKAIRSERNSLLSCCSCSARTTDLPPSRVPPPHPPPPAVNTSFL